MSINNISVDLSAHLVLIKDTDSIACSSCPEWFKHRGRCANSYPTKDDENTMVDCCPKLVTHEKCLDSTVYGAVIAVRMEMVNNEIELRLRCNFKKENPRNAKQPLNEARNQEFDDIDSYNRHVGLKHCQFLHKTSQYSSNLLFVSCLERCDGDPCDVVLSSSTKVYHCINLKQIGHDQELDLCSNCILTSKYATKHYKDNNYNYNYNHYNENNAENNFDQGMIEQPHEIILDNSDKQNTNENFKKMRNVSNKRDDRVNDNHDEQDEKHSDEMEDEIETQRDNFDIFIHLRNLSTKEDSITLYHGTLLCKTFMEDEYFIGNDIYGIMASFLLNKHNFFHNEQVGEMYNEISKSCQEMNDLEEKIQTSRKKAPKSGRNNRWEWFGKISTIVLGIVEKQKQIESMQSQGRTATSNEDCMCMYSIFFCSVTK